ncbi:MAG: hypothetical protein ACK5U8_10220, partial [Deltaproteobacteria bacterium]
SPAVSLAAFAAFKHRRASRSSSILRRIARDREGSGPRRHPGVAERSPTQSGEAAEDESRA